MRVTLSDSSYSILECILVKENRWFQFHRMNSQRCLQIWVKPLSGWIVAQASMSLWCCSNPASFSYPLCLSSVLAYLATRVKGQQPSPDQSFVSNIHYKRHPANSYSVLTVGAWEEMTGNWSQMWWAQNFSPGSSLWRCLFYLQLAHVVLPLLLNCTFQSAAALSETGEGSYLWRPCCC